MDKKKTWEERIVDSIISLFFFGLMVAAFDLIGIRLDWAGGLALSIVALLAFVITAIIGGIVHAIRLRRKSNG